MRPAAALPLLAAAALAAAAPAAAQEVWTGAAGSKSWNDGGNWASGRAPVPTIGLRAVFDDPAGAAFGFGGSAAFRFGTIELTTNSGPVSIKAPGIVLGGSVNSEPEVGFIAEDVARDAVLRNFSSGALTLRGGAAAGWNLVGSPTTSAFNLADIVPQEGDGIVVSTAAEPRNMTYADGNWGYIKNTVVEFAGRKFVKPVRVTDDSVIPAGVGFWYIRSEDAAGTATIDWVK